MLRLVTFSLNQCPLHLMIFNPADNPLLNQQKDDNTLIEPEFYISMVLVNGAEGIGTGWSTLIPSFNPGYRCEFEEAYAECADDTLVERLHVRLSRLRRICVMFVEL